MLTVKGTAWSRRGAASVAGGKRHESPANYQHLADKVLLKEDRSELAQS